MDAGRVGASTNLEALNSPFILTLHVLLPAFGWVIIIHVVEANTGATAYTELYEFMFYLFKDTNRHQLKF